jgi:pimeloyl-ACP methyl ester carboxylesterase
MTPLCLLRSLVRCVVASLGLAFFAMPTALAGVGPADAAQATGAPRFAERPCEIPVASPEIGTRLRCGTVRVLRDPTRPEAGHFDLAVVVKRSAAPKPGAAPLLILHGGPGGEQVKFMGQGSKDFVPGRDSIAFDMRGGGRTGPALCKNTYRALMVASVGALRGERTDTARRSAINACWDEMRAAGLLPEHFGTERNVGDAEAIRQALGIARWAVYSMSYGTAVAADYLARHPEVIESAVLDSLYPPEAFVPTVREAQGRAIDRLLEECAADTACAQRFPGLSRAQADGALAGLDAQPLEFHFQGQRYVANELAMRTALHGLFYSEATARAVPWFLDALGRRDGDALAPALGLPLFMGDFMTHAGGSVAGLMGTDCRDRPRHHAVAAGSGPSWMSMFTGVQDGACANWAVGTPPTLPVNTTVPVLVLSAGYDGFQPDGAAVAQAIGPAATAITVARAAHVVRGAGECPRGLVSRFITQPKQPLDTACLAAMSAPDFVLDVAPRPELIATAARLQSGGWPWGVVLLLSGSVVWVLGGVLVPALLGSYRRLRRSHAAQALNPSIHLAWAVVGLGVLAGVGLGVPLGVTFGVHPGAASFGLIPSLVPLLWLLPVAAVGAAVVGIQAARQRHWLSCSAALGVVLMSAGALGVGATPWA